MPSENPSEATDRNEMFAAYFDYWSSFWRDVSAALDNRPKPVKWVVKFGAIEKALDEVHPDTGITGLVSPLRQRIQDSLVGNFTGLTVVLTIDPKWGLMHAFRGRETVVRQAQAAFNLRGNHVAREDLRKSGEG